jgi:hypothetical protein
MFHTRVRFRSTSGHKSEKIPADDETTKQLGTPIGCILDKAIVDKVLGHGVCAIGRCKRPLATFPWLYTSVRNRFIHSHVPETVILHGYYSVQTEQTGTCVDISL